MIQITIGVENLDLVLMTAFIDQLSHLALVLIRSFRISIQFLNETTPRRTDERAVRLFYRCTGKCSRIVLTCVIVHDIRRIHLIRLLRREIWFRD